MNMGPGMASLTNIFVQVVKDTAKVLFWEVIDEMARVISLDEMQEVKSKLDFAFIYMNSVMLEVNAEMVR